MKNVYLLLVIMGLLNVSATAQDLIWAESIADWTQYIHIDDEDNFYLVGHLDEIKDFDFGAEEFPLEDELGSSDLYVARYTSEKELIWAKDLSTSLGGSTINDFCVDSEGNSYLALRLGGVVDVDPGAPVIEHTYISLGYDALVVKLNSEGEFEWEYPLISNQQNRIRSLHCDSENNLYITGDFQKTIDFDPGPDVYEVEVDFTGYGDSFITKLTTDRDLLWVKKISCDIVSEGEAFKLIRVSDNDDLYVYAEFGGAVSIDGNVIVEEDSEWKKAIIKFDSDGNYLWHYRMGLGGNLIILDFETNEANELFFTGTYTAGLQFDVMGELIMLPETEGQEYLVGKLNSLGECEWVNGYTGDGGNDTGLEISLDDFGNVYTTGIFHGDMDFDPSASETIPETYGDRDIFVHCMDPMGNFIYVRTMGSFTEDAGESLALNSNNEPLIAGRFRGVCDMDPSDEVENLISTGSNDGFVLKLSLDCDILPNGIERDGLVLSSTVESEEVSYQWVDCDDDYNPIPGATEQTYEPAENGNYAVIVTYGDCESISECIQICDFLPNGIEQDGLELSSTVDLEGISYQWVDCDDDYSAIPGATEQTYEVSENGSYAVIVTSETCESTSECVEIDWLSVHPEETQARIGIYPNPFSESARIVFKSNTSKTLIIYDMTGKEVFRKDNVLSNEFTLRKADIGTGVFSLCVIENTTNTSTFSKLIVQ